MSFRRIDMKEPYMTAQDKKDYKVLSRRFTWCDKHVAWPWQKEIGMLLTSHPGNRAYLRASIESHKKAKLWLSLVYDNYFHPDHKADWNHVMPDVDLMYQLDSLTIGPRQEWGGVLYPYFWLLRLGLATMGHFPYVYCANGDCIIERPEGVFEMLQRLKDEDADFISCGWWPKDRPIFNSTGFIGKREAVQGMMEHFEKYFVPLKAYEASCLEFGNCEGRMGAAIRELGYKVVELENPKNEQLHEKGNGDWCKALGFRHIHAEHGMWWRAKKTLIPPEVKYYDEKHISALELNAVKSWWDEKASS